MKTLLLFWKHVISIVPEMYCNLEVNDGMQVPWKLLKRPTLTTTKRVYICPERACLHHDPAHALGDLVGIKKHYRRKHCTEKQWKCDRCSKSYAVQSDYKAHLKTCGTRGHCCDCGRVFSRYIIDSFQQVARLPYYIECWYLKDL